MKMLAKIFILLLVIYTYCFSQSSSDLIYVDSSGRMRWAVDDTEAYFWGVNYAAPFAFSYRNLKNKGIDHKEVIDLDVQQFKRLGMNAYRIHVWDREVSDREGNLLVNEHIELLDYMISKLIENDIYIILTPIAWWGTGWPEPDLETPGFSTFYSKIESTTKPEVIKAQVKYLKQFVNHKNSYTGKAYKDEDYIIAFEIFNEPNLSRNRDSVTTYINTTVKVLRDEGITKPIFFNISENPRKEQWEGVASSNIDGISFQWYPTGLVKYSELNGNFIPNVFSYPLPDHTDKIKDKAKMVYEFDAADISKSYMYPLMAHSFKEAGMQWATMFCYDPTPLAQYNSEYQTHFLNLLYTPQKALSFLIASQLFSDNELTKKNIDSSSIIMDDVVVDYNSDLSLLNAPENFYYTNTNNISPINFNQLKHIAGYGNSKIIKYHGRGAYFLDRVSKGIWLLQVCPDVIWLKDPFGKNGLDEPVSKLLWKKNKIEIHLPELKQIFDIQNLETLEVFKAEDFVVSIEPGTYIISNILESTIDNLEADLPTDVDFKLIKKFGEFIDDLQSTEIKNLTPGHFYENDEKKITVEIYSNVENPELNVYLKNSSWRNYQKFVMHKVNDFVYEFVLNEQLSSNGLLEYYVSVVDNNDVLTFPGKINITPEYWSFNADNSYNLKIFPANNRRILYSPLSDTQNLISANLWRFVNYNIDYTFDENLEPELDINIRSVREEFPELALQINLGKDLETIQRKNNYLEFEMKKSSGELDSIMVRVIYNNSSGFERWISPSNEYEKIVMPLFQPEKFKYALLPRPYPTFLPYWFESIPSDGSISNLKPESVQIAIPLPEPGMELNGYGLKLKAINLLTKNKPATNVKTGN